MSQANQKLQLLGVGINPVTWTPVTVPITECHNLQVINPDLGSVLNVCTDPADPNSALPIQPQSSQILTLSAAHRGLLRGETACYLMGGGTALVAFSV